MNMNPAKIASATVLLVVLGGCINGAGMTNDALTGRASDDKIQALNWGVEGARPHLVGTLGSPGASGQKSWPGSVDAEAKAVDIDGDGSLEVLVHSRDRNVYVFNAKGDILAKLPVRYPPSWHVDNVLNAPEAGVLRPNDPMSIVVASPAAYITVWQFDPQASKPGDMVFKQMWEKRTDGCHRSPGMDAPAVLANIDGKAGLEILVHTEQVGLFALRANGDVLWSHCWAGGNGAPVAADLNGDGRTEAIFASDSGFLSVFDGASGTPQWTFNAADKKYGITPASVTVAPTVAELDGKYPREILFTTRHAPSGDADKFDDYHMGIFAVRQNPSTYAGELVWMRQPEWANPLSYTVLLAEDVDGDGRTDIFGMDWNTIGHNPGEWEVLEGAHAFRLDADGNDVWVRQLETWWSNKAVVLVDADGDGEKELLVNAPKGTDDGIWRLSVSNGASEGFITAHPWRISRGPVMAEMGGDLHMIVTVSPPDEGPQGAALVYDLGVKA